MLLLLLLLVMMVLLMVVALRVVVVMVLVVVVIGRGWRERLATITMHGRAKRVTAGPIFLRQRADLARPSVIPTLANRYFSRP